MKKKFVINQDRIFSVVIFAFSIFMALETRNIKPLHIQRFTSNELIEMLQPLLLYYPSRDRGIITERVCETVLSRQKLF